MCAACQEKQQPGVLSALRADGDLPWTCLFHYLVQQSDHLVLADPDRDDVLVRRLR